MSLRANSNPTHIQLAGGNETFLIAWEDGHRSAYPYAFLRNHCPCATCTDHGLAERPSTPDASLASPLPPILGPGGPLKPTRADLVGNYALQIFWSDGHSTGIYTFEILRGLCPCPECAG